MVPPLCYKHNDIHSKLINALHFAGVIKSKFFASEISFPQIKLLFALAINSALYKEPDNLDSEYL